MLSGISSAELIRSLCVDEEKPWATYNRNAPIKPRQIATRLKEFGIISNTIRIGMLTAKDYMKTQFSDAFARYLTVTNVTTSQAHNYNAFGVTDTLQVAEEEVTRDYEVT